MIFKKKISAFTLTELLLVLAITAIVAGLSFTIITLFTKNIHNIENNYSRGTQLSLFSDQLTVDFNRFHNIDYDPLEKQLIFKNPLDSIIYTWKEDWVLREKDTVLNIPTKLELYYTGGKVDNGNTDAIKVWYGKKEEDNFIFVFLNKDAYNQIRENGDKI